MARQRLAMPSTLIAPSTDVLVGFDGVVLIMARRGGAGQVVDFVNLQQDRLGNIVADELEIRPAQQMRDVDLLAGEEVVEADHVVPFIDQPLAQMRTQKSGAAGDQDPAMSGHAWSYSRGSLQDELRAILEV